MTLLDSELARIKAELGFNVLNVGAEPYVGVTRYFEQVVVPNLNSAAIATSSTAVTAVTPVAPGSTSPTPVDLTLSSATGFAMFARVVVDVDELAEMATVRSVTGSTINVALVGAHSGTYPVCVESGETLVRYYLGKCRATAELIKDFGDRAGIKSADKADVVFFGADGEKNGLQTLGDFLTYWRSQLCMLLFGVGNISQLRIAGSGGGGSRVALY